MSQYLYLFSWFPLIGYFLSLLVPRRQEGAISLVAIATAGIHLAGILAFTAVWAVTDRAALTESHVLLFEKDNIRISVDFYFDWNTAAFACVGSFLTFLITVYSRYFIHREGGFKRFFNTIILFFTGYNILIFSGNFETMFIGWELLGVCTFLLVAFYRERYLPVKNSMKVISIYRLGDVCLMLAMWMGHHLWHENVTFEKLNDGVSVAALQQVHYWDMVFIASMILIAAAVKSAQLPFSSWMPRAMEGPTTSSAMFYGALSIHIGVFLLLRTYNYWEGLIVIRSNIVLLGLATSIVAINIARVQSSLKPQIAYSSIAQIGLMFVEIGLGLHWLALIHFSGNAILRTYQLLVSPSVQSYAIHEMFFNFVPRAKGKFSKLGNTMYMLSLKEWSMDTALRSYLWNPFKWFGARMSLLSSKVAAVVLVIIYLAGLYCYYFMEQIPADELDFLPVIFAFIGALMILKAFSERGNALWAWCFVMGGQLFMTLAVALHNDHFSHSDMLIYLGGSLVAAVVGFVALSRVQAIDGDIHLNRFHGYAYEQPKLGNIFLISCLAMIGIPFTPSFIGIDILYSHIHKSEELLVVFVSIGFLFMELALLRIYARIFMGQHKKASHAIAFRSS